MSTMILGSVLAILNIAAIFFLLIVLIKQFSKGGFLQGLLGMITCGLWTFIWGWIKHRQHNLTKVMTMWSVAYVVSMVIGVMFGGVIGMEAAKLMGEATGEFKAEIEKQKGQKPTGPKKINLPNRKRAAKQNKPSAGQADPQKLASVAMGLWQNGRYTDPESAVDHWSSVIEARLDSAEAFNNRGIGHFNARRYLEAISDYDQAIRLKANYAVAFNNRGNARYEMAKYQEALADYSASLRINPQYANAHSNRGLAYFRLSKHPQACEDFQKACELGSCETLKWAVSQNICK